MSVMYSACYCSVTNFLPTRIFVQMISTEIERMCVTRSGIQDCLRRCDFLSFQKLHFEAFSNREIILRGKCHCLWHPPGLNSHFILSLAR